MPTDTSPGSSVDFDAVPKSMKEIVEFIRNQVANPVPADVPGAVAVNEYLSKQRELARLPLPDVPDMGGMKQAFEQMQSDVGMLKNLIGSGLVIEQTSVGIHIRVPDNG